MFVIICCGVSMQCMMRLYMIVCLGLVNLKLFKFVEVFTLPCSTWCQWSLMIWVWVLCCLQSPLRSGIIDLGTRVTDHGREIVLGRVRFSQLASYFILESYGIVKNLTLFGCLWMLSNLHNRNLGFLRQSEPVLGSKNLSKPVEGTFCMIESWNTYVLKSSLDIGRCIHLALLICAGFLCIFRARPSCFWSQT